MTGGNKDTIKKYNAKYWSEHKEQISKKRKEHYEKHREEILEKQKLWVEQNRDRWNKYQRERRAKLKLDKGKQA